MGAWTPKFTIGDLVEVDDASAIHHAKTGVVIFGPASADGYYYVSFDAGAIGGYREEYLKLVAVTTANPRGQQVALPFTPIDLEASIPEVKLRAGYRAGPTEEERAKRKATGCCEECGKLLPMSIWGLGDCPEHPKEVPQ